MPFLFIYCVECGNFPFCKPIWAEVIFYVQKNLVGPEAVSQKTLNKYLFPIYNEILK